MWISKRKLLRLEEKVAGLKDEIQRQQLVTTIVFEFCRSVANKENLSLLSYQQLNSPSTDSSEKIRMLFQQIRKFGQGAFD